IFSILLCNFSNAQTKVEMQKVGGIYYVPCSVNGLPLKFVFDTGASDVSISLTEAVFMLKNGYLNVEDVGESVYYSIANGDVAKGTKLNIKEIEFAGLKLYNVEASIVHETSAPLLLGQSVISKLGKIELEGNQLTILNAGKANFYDYNKENNDFTGKRTVFSFSPILDRATRGEYEEQIGAAQNNTVTIIEKVNKDFYKVKSGDIVGYLWVGWFK